VRQGSAAAWGYDLTDPARYSESVNARIKRRLQNRGVTVGARESALAAEADRLAREGCSTDEIVHRLAALSPSLTAPAAGEVENLNAIARRASTRRRIQSLVDLGLTLQEARLFLSGPSVNSRNLRADDLPDYAMRLYRMPDNKDVDEIAARNQALYAAEFALRDESARRNREDSGTTPSDFTEALGIARSEAKTRHDCGARGLELDDLVEIGLRVITDERRADGSPLEGGRLRLRMRRRMNDAILARKRSGETPLLPEHDNISHEISS
jgi:hypothetical protein